jgi:DNA-binding NarL/FixJ family response regulator
VVIAAESYRGSVASHMHLATAAHAPGRMPDHARVRVVLVEAHETMRRSLRLLLDGEPDLEVVSESGMLAPAIHQLSRLDPDVLALDLWMPEGSSFDIVRRLHVQVPRTRIVVITMYDDQAFARHAHRSGAFGFVLKDTADAELVEAVRRAAHGQIYTSPRVAPGAMALRTP